jgi:endo-1,4-beta-xylanase
VGQVANHTYSHPRFAQVSQARRLQELQMGAKALDYPNAFFRPPYGETGPDVEADVRATGLITVYWTVDVRDQGLGADAIAKQALTVEPGGIVRLHEGVATTIEAIPAIVAGLQKRGMCPGFLGATPEAVSAPGGTQFHALAVKP